MLLGTYGSPVSRKSSSVVDEYFSGEERLAGVTERLPAENDLQE